MARFLSILFPPTVLAVASPASAALVQPPPSAEAQAQGSLAGLFRPDDYPSGAAARGAQGSAQVRLTIDTDGLVHSCTVIESAGDDELDLATCNVLQARARYEPARNARGQPVPDMVTARIRWALGETVAPGTTPLIVLRTVSSVTRAADGTYSCWFEINGSRVLQNPGTECRRFAPPGGPPGPAEYRIVTNFVPAAEAERPDESAIGRAVADAEALVTVQPDGTLGVCRVLRQTGSLAQVDFCAMLRSNWNRFDQAPDGRERHMRARVTHYVRLGSQR